MSLCTFGFHNWTYGPRHMSRVNGLFAQYWVQVKCCECCGKEEMEVLK